MKLLVTGGAGFIGSVCAQVLLERGHEVVVIDDLSTGNADSVPAGANFICGDFAKIAESVLADGSFYGVLHFAAKSLIGQSVSAPALYWHENLVKTLSLLDAMRASGTARLVVSSTAATYGEPSMVPVTEAAPTRPTNPYGASKLAVDLAIASYCAAYEFSAVSLRYFNVGGAYGRLGERRREETHLVPLALKVAAGTRSELLVFGNDWPTRDGTAIRDFVHVRDVVEAHVLALESRLINGNHRIYNLGCETGYTVREVISCCERISGRLIRSRDIGRRDGDPAVLVSSSLQAREELGWHPRFGLEEIVRDAWDFAERPY